jgi:hypothetical protein
VIQNKNIKKIVYDSASGKELCPKKLNFGFVSPEAPYYSKGFEEVNIELLSYHFLSKPD